MNTTYQRLFEAEIETNVERQAHLRASATYGFLLAVASIDKRGDDRFPHTTYYRHKAALRRAGLLPLESSAGLAAIARDLGLTDRDSLARLVWTLNGDRKQSLARVLATHVDLLAAALAELDIDPDSPKISVRDELLVGAKSAGDARTRPVLRSRSGLDSLSDQTRLGDASGCNHERG
jgi:hypothetical protein